VAESLKFGVKIDWFLDTETFSPPKPVILIREETGKEYTYLEITGFPNYEHRLSSEKARGERRVIFQNWPIANENHRKLLKTKIEEVKASLSSLEAILEEAEKGEQPKLTF